MTLNTITQSVHDRLVRETADKYTRQGYAVQIEPQKEELPEFLHGFHPDLIVVTPDERIVVEVKTKGKVRRLEYWEQLKIAVEQQHGWKLRLVLDNRREQEIQSLEQPVLARDQIEAQLHTATVVREMGAYRAALILIWAALEAILRTAGRAQGLQLPNQGPGPLLTTLYSEGDLSQDDYKFLRGSLQARHQAAHGFSSDDVNKSLVDEVQQIAERLLNTL